MRRGPTLIDAVRFPSDPHETILEQNEVAVLLRSDDLGNIREGAKALFEKLDVFRMTSIRRGFVGGASPAGPASRSGWRMPQACVEPT